MHVSKIKLNVSDLPISEFMISDVLLLQCALHTLYLEIFYLETGNFQMKAKAGVRTGPGRGLKRTFLNSTSPDNRCN